MGRALREAKEQVIKEIEWNGHHYKFTNTFHNTGTKSHDVLVMEDENGNEWQGETTWVNRPWHRFDLEEAFDEIVSKAFGQKALEMVREIDKDAYNVEDVIEKFFAQLKPEDVQTNNVETIDDSEEGRKNALAKYLEVDPSEIEEVGDNEFAYDDATYKVLTDDEADYEFDEAVRNLWDEGGLEYCSRWTKDWILSNGLDESEFEDFVMEDESNYVNDLDDEEVADECINEGIVESYEVYNEESDEYSPELRDDVDFDELRDKLIDVRVQNIMNEYTFGEYLENIGFDMDYMKNYIDDEKAIEAIKDDIDTNGSGRGQELAYYDGDEIELDGNLYAYRIN